MTEIARPNDLRPQGVLTFRDLKELADEQPDFLVRDLITIQSVNILVGRSGLGKTPLCVTLGLCVASGVPFLGHPVRQGKVLYAAGEGDPLSYVTTIESISRGLGLNGVPETFLFWSPNYPLQSIARFGDALTSKVAEVRPALTIADTLRTFWPYAETKNQDAANLIRVLRRANTDNGQHAWLLTHHLRKENRNLPPTILETDCRRWFEEASGALSLSTNADTRLGLELSKKHPGALAFAGYRRTTGEFGPIYLERRFDDCGEPLYYERLTGTRLLNDREREVFDNLPDRFTWGQAFQQFSASSKSVVRNFIDHATGAGLIRKETETTGYVKVPSPNENVESLRTQWTSSQVA